MRQLSDIEVHVKLKLCALWASAMFCYIYCDYFELYVPGKLEEMRRGQMGPLGTVTQEWTWPQSPGHGVFRTVTLAAPE